MQAAVQSRKSHMNTSRYSRGAGPFLAGLFFLASTLFHANANSQSASAPLPSPTQGASAPMARVLGDALTRGIGIGADQIKATKRLPVQGMSIIETVDGKTFVVSDNGRVAIIGGRIIDLFENREIKGIADTESLDHINLKRMGIKGVELATFTIGNGPVEAIVFVDPMCEPCRALVSEMPKYVKQYTFQVLVYPLRGGPSGVAARALACAPDKSLALTAFTSGRLESLPQPSRNCDVANVQKAMITGSVLGIRSLPFMILPGGKTFSGPAFHLADALPR